jgi:sugar O-acyltransferase (sialic acid O-acetyltransferase NeuD family)
MRPLLLVAASGLAREVLSVLDQLPEFEVVGILDDEQGLHGTFVQDVPVVGPINAVARYPNAELVLCAGRGSARRLISNRLARMGVADDRYAVVTDPSVCLPRTCSIGAGSILLAQTVLTAHVRIGHHVVVMPNATLTHDNVVEDFGTVCAGVSLGGNVLIGAAAYIGMNASVRERTMVGPDATVGMGACVLADIPAGEVWAGVPAKSLTKVAPW